MDELENENLPPSSPMIPKLLLGLLLVTAFALRAWQLQHISVEHFDEGVYASNFYASHLDFRYPDQHLYAPPLFPAILEWVLILTGNPHAVVWVNIVLGTALVAAIWWLTKLIAGKEAALAAAAVATFNDFLIQYSRAVLTDTPVCLFMVLAVACGSIAFRDRHSIAAIGAALFTAAAWWTKYNGWLPLAILGAGLAGWIVFDRPKRSEWQPRIGTLLFIACGAFLLWSPFLWSLQEFGGYSAVAKNHAGYVVGFSGWWDSASRQLENQHFYSTLTMFGVLVAGCLIQFVRQPQISQWNRKFWFLIFLLILICTIEKPFILLLLIAIDGLRKNKEIERHGFWILAAWLIGLLVFTPTYRPYPRLMMPFMISIFIATGLGLAAHLKFTLDQSEVQSGVRLIRRFGLLGLCLFFTFKSGVGESTYQNRSQFKDISTAIVYEMQSSAGTTKQLGDLNAIVYVIGEPGLYYHLASQSSLRFEFIAQPGSNLAMLMPKLNEPELPTFLVLGPHALEEMQELKKQSELAKLIEEFSYQPSDLVLLDDFPPKHLEENRQQTVELWKLTRP
ncbi:glycosyltransferase family 39 protein [Planctomicrobium sp.]|nr:glycosyltransferase family 39 protein [Planctomicrobium sp.]